MGGHWRDGMCLLAEGLGLWGAILGVSGRMPLGSGCCVSDSTEAATVPCSLPRVCCAEGSSCAACGLSVRSVVRVVPRAWWDVPGEGLPSRLSTVPCRLEDVKCEGKGMRMANTRVGKQGRGSPTPSRHGGL